MPTSLVKFFDKTESNGKKLYWSRSAEDGMPFRGTHAPLMAEDEYLARVVKVADTKNDFFDVTDPEQNRRFLHVMDCCFNGWFQCVYVERFWNKTTKHYLEWIEYFCEDGATRTPFSKTQGTAEVADGPGNVSFNPQGG